MVVQTSLTKQNLGCKVFLCLIKKPCVKKGTQQSVRKLSKGIISPL